MVLSVFFFIGKLQSGALPYWWLDAKRPYLSTSSKPCEPQRSRTEGHHRLSSARSTYRPPPLGRWSKCGGSDTVMVLLRIHVSKVPKETQLEWFDPARHWWTGSDASQCIISTLCLKKMHQLWNDIARNYKDRFWWYLAEMFKILQNRVCMFQFSCRFAFNISFPLSNRTWKITQILTLFQANAPTLTRCNFLIKHIKHIPCS